RVMEFRQQHPSESTQTHEPARQPQSAQYSPLQHYTFPYPTDFSQVVAPAPIATRPNDYYADDHARQKHIKERLGHVAHVVGTAATRSAHRDEVYFSARPF